MLRVPYITFTRQATPRAGTNLASNKKHFNTFESGIGGAGISSIIALNTFSIPKPVFAEI
jgi:hypothetical protein